MSDEQETRDERSEHPITAAAREAELAMLGALLLEPDRAAQLLPLLDPKDFTSPAHEVIWETAANLHADGIAPNTPALINALAQDKVFNRAGGHRMLLDLRPAELDPAPQPEHHAGIVRDAARLRKVAEVARHLKHAAATADLERVDDAMARAVDILDEAAGRFGPGTRSAGGKDDASSLPFHTLGQMRDIVTQQGPRRWLIRGMWPAGTYGVHAAEQKAQKTWNAFDLAVSIASGTPWLGHFPVDDPGPVIIFAGEGGEGDVVRRLDGIAKARNVIPDSLPIVICAKAPHLSNTTHMAHFARALATHRPRLVVLDPLYLAARGADLKDLYAMGALLETAQHACAQVDAALWVNHHHNRSRDAKGSGRMSGAGPAEWGRVLIGAKVISRHTNPDTKETRVLTELEVIGGSIPDATFRIFRKIHADDPDDLDSPLRYDVEVLAVDEPPAGAEKNPTNLTPSQTKLLEALRAKTEPANPHELVDWIADKYGHGLTRETVSKALNGLLAHEAVDYLEVDQPGGRFPEKRWFIPTHQETTDAA